MVHVGKWISHLLNLCSLHSQLAQFHTFHCHRGISVQAHALMIVWFKCVHFMFPRVEREYETSRVEQLVPGTHPDSRPLLVHQPVFCPHRCNPATGGSAVPRLPWLHAHQQTKPAPQHRFVSLWPWFITHLFWSVWNMWVGFWRSTEVIFILSDSNFIFTQCLRDTTISWPLISTLPLLSAFLFLSKRSEIVQ